MQIPLVPSVTVPIFTVYPFISGGNVIFIPFTVALPAASTSPDKVVLEIVLISPEATTCCDIPFAVRALSIADCTCAV